MFTALIVLALAKYYGWSTKPVTPSFTDPADNYAPIFAPAESRPDRSFWHIALSCLATLLAVAWISARQNTPWLEDMTCPLLKGWSLLKRRIFVMCLAIVRPEEMILNAFRQWRDAVVIKVTFNKAHPRSSIILFALDFGISEADQFLCRSAVDNGTFVFLTHGWLHSELYKGRTPSLFVRL